MEQLVSEAYVYIEDGKYKSEPGRGDVKELVKLEHDLVGDIDWMSWNLWTMALRLLITILL